MEVNKRVELSVQSNDVLTYALQQNGVELISKVSIRNVTEEDIKGLFLKIHTDTELIEPFQQGIEILRAGEEMELRHMRLFKRKTLPMRCRRLALKKWDNE